MSLPCGDNIGILCKLRLLQIQRLMHQDPCLKYLFEYYHLKRHCSQNATFISAYKNILNYVRIAYTIQPWKRTLTATLLISQSNAYSAERVLTKKHSMLSDRFISPTVNLSRFLIKVYSDKKNLFAGVHITAVIIPFFDLQQGNLIAFIQFEFKNKHKILIRRNSINSAIVCSGFCYDTYTEQHKNRIKQQLKCEVKNFFVLDGVRSFSSTFAK